MSNVDPHPPDARQGARAVIFAGKIQIALVVRRTRENRAGAIAHQNKIRHIDRQQPVRVKRVAHEKPGVIAQLLAPSMSLSLVPRAAHMALKSANSVSVAASSSVNGWSGESAQKLAPYSVSGRVV